MRKGPEEPRPAGAGPRVRRLRDVHPDGRRRGLFESPGNGL